MHTTDWISGNVFLRPRNTARGDLIAGHKHNFDHTHFVISGWFLVRGWVNGIEVVHQKAANEYGRLRQMRLRHEPETVLRPIRFADTGEGFNMAFIKPGEAVPDGGTEIIYAPTGYHCLIYANTLHDMVSLDEGHGVCVYSHREPQGEVALTRTGWDTAYV